MSNSLGDNVYDELECLHDAVAAAVSVANDREDELLEQIGLLEDEVSELKATIVDLVDEAERNKGKA